MDRFSELETFVAVAESGGFNAAARRLGRSAPSVTRIVASLEQRLGARLFTRTTRRIATTETGERLLHDARALLDDLQRVEAVASGARESPKGTLSLTAPAIFGRRYIAPLVRSFVERHEGVSARLLFVDRVVNLIEEGLDLAARIGELPDSQLRSVRVGNVRRILVASPDYCARHGRPETLDALKQHRLAAPTTDVTIGHWDFVKAGQTRSLQIRPALRGNSIDACIDAARSGWCVTRVLSYQVAGALRSGKLVELLKDEEDRLMPVHLVHSEGELRSAKIRAFLDHAVPQLRAESGNWMP